MISSLLCWFCLLLSQRTVAVNVAAIVSTSSEVGKQQRTAIEIAAQRFRSSSSVRFFGAICPWNDPLGAEAVVKNFSGASWRADVVVLGSETWSEATLVAAAMKNDLQALIMSFPTSPTLAPATLWPNVLRMTDYVSSPLQTVAAFVASYCWRRVIVIYEDDAVGSVSGSIGLLSSELRGIGSEIDCYRAFPPHGSLAEPGTAIRQGLRELRGQVSQVFVVTQASMPFVSDLFMEATELGMMSKGHVWIVNGIPFDSFSASFLSSYMQGVVGITAYVDKKVNSSYQDFCSKFQRSFQTLFPNQLENPDPAIVTLRLYDTVAAIAGAGEENSRRAEDTILRGFDGLSGEVRFRGRELSSDGAVVELVNVVGGSYRRMGFWAKRLGFHEQVGRGSHRVEALGPVFWPGGPSRVPGGWRSLAVGIPANATFHQFVKVELGKNQSISSVVGFSIEVFEEAVRRLPYDLPFRYSLHVGRYDELVHRVYSGDLDAAVGDITILANRSKFVDFTEPYMESSLSMLVPLKQRPGAWDFMKPFTKKMWIMIAAAFIYTGTVVWFLEHRTNPDFKGPWQNQLAMGIWFSFSTFFFTHGRLNSNFARAVIAVWLFVVLVLTSSYTASLSSILTVESLEPKTGDIKSLGVNRDVFVANYVQDVFGFKSGFLKTINLNNKTDLENLRQGKITAAIFETPYIRAFLSRHSDEYSISEENHRLRGLGFVFPKGSPLVTDISRSILSMSDDATLKRLEDKWISFDLVSCPRPKQDKTRGSLGLESFWVLFATTGGTSTFIVVLFVVSLVTKGKHLSWIKGKLPSTAEAKPQLPSSPFSASQAMEHVIEDATLEPTNANDANESTTTEPLVVNIEGNTCSPIIVSSTT